MIKIFLPFFIFFSLNSGVAQNFKFKTKLNPVEVDGFYKIELSPEIIARAGYSLPDLRIAGEDGSEIPYIINNETASFYEKDFVPFIIDQNTSKGNSQTLIINNINHQTINNLVIELKNTYGEKKVRISGSEDKKNWFMLHQGFTFTVPGDENSTTIYQAIDFPMANYAWFSIVFTDTIPLSLNISRVGNYKQTVISGKYTTLPRTLFFQKDSNDKKSYILILLEEPNIVDVLKIHIDKPGQYLRNGFLKINYLGMDTLSSVKEISSSRYYNEGIKNQILTLNSDLVNAFEISNKRKIVNFTLIIENNDNKALEIGSIELQQLKTYLSAKLEKGKTYFIQFGDSSLDAPIYDLKYFENKIPKNIPVIKHQAIQSNHPDNNNSKETDNKNRFYIWIALGLAGILLAFMTTKMLKELKKGT